MVYRHDKPLGMLENVESTRLYISLVFSNARLCPCAVFYHLTAYYMAFASL